MSSSDITSPVRLQRKSSASRTPLVAVRWSKIRWSSSRVILFLYCLSCPGNPRWTHRLDLQFHKLWCMLDPKIWMGGRLISLSRLSETTRGSWSSWLLLREVVEDEQRTHDRPCKAHDEDETLQKVSPGICLIEASHQSEQEDGYTEVPSNDS